MGSFYTLTKKVLEDFYPRDIKLNFIFNKKYCIRFETPMAEEKFKYKENVWELKVD